MIIPINRTSTLKSINDRFNKHYPFLKLEFYNSNHRWKEASTKQKILNLDLTLEELNPKARSIGFIEIPYWQKTGNVEQSFRDKYDLNVQIFRKNGLRWIQTVGTDEFSLDLQNEIGKIDSIDLENIINYHPLEKSI
jgi:hypothetical protein